MKNKNESETSIIGGSEGESSIFIADKPKNPKEQRLGMRIQSAIYKYKYKRAEQTIVANAHTLAEVVQYAMLHYETVEVESTKKNFIEQRNNLKENLILQHKPEILGEMENIPVPDTSNEAAFREYINKIEARSKMIAKMPDDVIPMDYHLYEIRTRDVLLEMEIDYIWDVFGVSFIGTDKTIKQLRKISKDLYHYYGVNEEDIRNKTERYTALVVALSL